MELIKEDTKQEVKNLAEESMTFVEPICLKCWENGQDDPLGTITGVNTKYNKKINEIAEQIARNNSEASPEWITEIRQELVEIFHEHRQRIFNAEDRAVDELECFYCFEQKKREDGELSMRIKDKGDNEMFDKSIEDWR